jgi:hypothetical protein
MRGMAANQRTPDCRNLSERTATGSLMRKIPLM